MSAEKIKCTEYNDATTFKLKNRRVQVVQFKDDLVIELVKLNKKEDAHKVASVHKVIRDRITITGMKITREAAMCIMLGIHKELKRVGYITWNRMPD